MVIMNVSFMYTTGNVTNHSVITHTDHLLANTTLTAIWSTSPITFLLTLLTGVAGNGSLLLLILQDASLRTPFNLYIINLIIANLMSLLLQYPMQILADLYSGIWFIGDGACTYYLYGTWVIAAVVYNSHLLIALNRVWAVVRPISYRSIHTDRLAVCMCLGVWIYAHLVLAPVFLNDALYARRRPVRERGCFLNTSAMGLWETFAQLLAFTLPSMSTYLAFPVIVCTRMLSNRNSHVQRNSVFPVLQESSAVRTTHSVPAVVAARSRPNRLNMTTRQSHGYVLMLLLTASQAVCWSPINVYYIIVMFLPNFWQPKTYEISLILFCCQTTLDPIMFTFAVRNLREAAQARIRGWCG